MKQTVHDLNTVKSHPPLPKITETGGQKEKSSQSA